MSQQPITMLPEHILGSLAEVMIEDGVRSGKANEPMTLTVEVMQERNTVRFYPANAGDMLHVNWRLLTRYIEECRSTVVCSASDNEGIPFLRLEGKYEGHQLTIEILSRKAL